MLLEHLNLLRSPKNQKPLKLLDPVIENGRIKSGELSDGENFWPIINFIPRFVPENEYWDSFSFQWAKHPRLLTEQFSGYTVYKDRFEKETQWPSNLTREIIIEAGCGSGGFTKYALATGATVISFDVSKSVDFSYRDNCNPNLLIVQASIYEMPFIKVDRIYCFGVVQHTPDPRASLQALVNQLKPGGYLASDIYAKVELAGFGPYNLLKTKYILRKWSVKLNKERLHRLITIYIKVMWWPCLLLQKCGNVIKKIGDMLQRLGSMCDQLSALVLIDNYKVRMRGMASDKLQEFAILDVFDMLSPEYDIPVALEEYRNWHQEMGLQFVDVHYGYNGIEGRGVKSR